MDEWLIFLIALWTYPVIALVFIRMTRTRPVLRKKVFRISIILLVLTCISLLTGVSTTSTLFDWVLLTNFYLLPCLLIFTMVESSILWTKVTGIISMIVVCTAGYLISTVGALGLGFALNEHTPDREEWVDDGYIVKEIILGNAISDHRGKRVEISRTCSWLPLFEIPVTQKEYSGFDVYGDSLDVHYSQDDGTVALKIEYEGFEPSIIWSDTIHLHE